MTDPKVVFLKYTVINYIARNKDEPSTIAAIQAGLSNVDISKNDKSMNHTTAKFALKYSKSAALDFSYHF